MFPVQFDRAFVEDGALWLLGEPFSAKVEARSGTWRVLVYQRPEDENKGSFAVVDDTRLPLSWDKNRVLAEGLPPLRLDLAPFHITFENLTFDLAAHPLGTWREQGGLFDPSGLLHPPPPAEGRPLGGGFTLTLAEREGRRYFGLGERTGFLDKKGRRYTLWNTDEFDHEEGTDALYQSHPFLLIAEGGKAQGLFIDETWRLVFDLAKSDPRRATFTTPGPTFDFYLLPGPRPAEVVQQLARLTGTAPLPPLWALGYHQCRYGYQSQAELLALAEAFKAHNIPLSALWMDIDHMEGYKVFTFDKGRFPDPKALADRLNEEGVKLVAIVDPGVKKEPGYAVYEEGKKLDAFVKNARGDEVVGEVWPKSAVWPDFTQARVRRFWGELHRFYLERGVAGFWNDMNEPSVFSIEGLEQDAHQRTLPPGALHGGRTHAEVHNVYALAMNQATFEGMRALAPERRPFILTRAGFTSIQRYAWVWTGDNKSYWGHLEMSIPMLLNLGLSGVPFVGADIGGFSEDATPELLLRWTQLGVFYPFMRNHAAKTSRRQEPFAFGEPWTERIARAIRLRYLLLPYVYTLAEEASRTGAPLMRPLFWHFPEEDEAYRVFDQFLFGPALLVAPITRPGQTARAVWLPPGRWQDWWTGELYQGLAWVVAQADLERIPLFLRQGFAVPLALEPERKALIPLAFRAFPEGTSSGEAYLDPGDGHAPGRRLKVIVGASRVRIQGADPVRVFRIGPDGSQTWLN